MMRSDCQKEAKGSRGEMKTEKKITVKINFVIFKIIMNHVFNGLNSILMK